MIHIRAKERIKITDEHIQDTYKRHKFSPTKSTEVTPSAKMS